MKDKKEKRDENNNNVIRRGERKLKGIICKIEQENIKKINKKKCEKEKKTRRRIRGRMAYRPRPLKVIYLSLLQPYGLILMKYCEISS